MTTSEVLLSHTSNQAKFDWDMKLFPWKNCLTTQNGTSNSRIGRIAGTEYKEMKFGMQLSLLWGEKGLARHAKSWRGPVGLAGKRALVIGNANSSNDIAAHLTPVAQRPVYRSVQHTAFPGFSSLPDEHIEDVAPVQSYDLDTMTNKITAHLENGTIIEDIDQVIVGNEYRPYPSFIHVCTEGQLRPLIKGWKEWAENWVRAGEHDNRAMPSSILQFSILAASKEEHAGGFREEAVKAHLEWGGTYVEWIEEKGLEREDVPDEVCSIEVGEEEQD
ncbi:flavin dependent monooxygenase [Moniliophthora roreri MCA 2997]|uniref:Flavin dependent monooxygenase n=1 Tax=Moniliophthora roreri (strain MCA 2997) TaxID=1381753 RepID=V2YD70_MONRO|nr:flavin dependent monooxygenase [Moniliophthora roreri MCA 2997]